jgi:hypothetical protein
MKLNPFIRILLFIPFFCLNIIKAFYYTCEKVWFGESEFERNIIDVDIEGFEGKYHKVYRKRTGEIFKGEEVEIIK